MSTNYAPTPQRNCNYITTLLLGWFLGAFGAHRFYTGKMGSAIAMLIMTLTGFLAPISGIWQLVDIFSIALNKFTDVDGNELQDHNPGCGMIALIVLITSFVIGGVLFLLSILSLSH